MNETKPDTAPPVAESEALGQKEEPGGRGERKPSRGDWRIAVTLALLAATAVVGWQWYDTRTRIDAIREELGQRLRVSDNTTGESRVLAKQALEDAREAQTKLSVLENKIAESQSHQVALEALYQDLSRSRDEWALAEIEQMLTMASQQLQLSGNVQAALLALRTAEGRLARADQPQFIPLRRLINRDIERLKAAPSLDITGMALRLDHLIEGVDALPLPLDERTLAAPDSTGSTAVNEVWMRVLTEVWSEMKQLVRIRVMDQPDAVLLSPSQSYFLRQNLQLRLLSARQALLVRDPVRFTSDLGNASAWIKRYFDMHAAVTAAMLANLKQLQASGINVELPSIDESLAAVRNFKMSHPKAVP